MGASDRPAARGRASPVALVVAITLLGALLRFATLNVQSIWLDESDTMLLVHRGFSAMLSHLPASESSPPLYYVLVWVWTRVFGGGPIGFRSFSALAGTLTIPVMYLAARETSARVGVWAAALTAVSPAMYYYSQEARDYGLLILLTAAAYALWRRALQAPDGRRLALWAGVSILAVLTHYFTAFVFVPEALVLAWRLGWRRVAVPAGAVVLVGLALVPLAASQIASNKVHWIEETSLISRLGETAKLFFVGVYGPLEIFSALLAALLAVGAFAVLLRRGDPREWAPARDGATVAVLAIVLPLVPAAAHVLDVFDGRNVIAVWVPFAVLLACALGAGPAGRGVRTGTAGRGVGTTRAGRAVRAPRAPRGVALLGGGLCVISLAVIAATNAIPAYQRDDWRGVAHALASPAAARVIVSEQYAWAPLSIYTGGLQIVTAPTVYTRELDFVGLRTRRTGRSPAPPVVPLTAPSGFSAAGVSRTETFAISRFRTASARTVSVRSLRASFGEHSAEIISQR